jgi:hypothetical protein
VTGQDLLGRITGALVAAGIPYMVTGSFASSHHGRPRATQDLDIVIAPTAEQLDRLVGSLPRPQYYVVRDAALEALRHEDQFNLIETESGWKVDFIIRKSRPFSRTEFDRRVPADIHGSRVFVASAEDVLLAKLEWAKRGGSERQIEDAAGILLLWGAELDASYIRHWVTALGLEAQEAAARRMAEQAGT